MSTLRKYGLDLLVVLAAVESALEVAFRHDAARAPRTTLWFAVPAVVAVVVPLLARRRFRFVAPAAVWVVAAAASFGDGRLIVFPAAVFVVGMVAAFLLGNLPDAFQARAGLAVVVGAAAVLTYNDPSHSASALVFTPVLFAIAWTVGLAVRVRADQADAAEVRADRAERDRETAARLAVAEERARIARELHDIVAHSVSVMVLQAGAVRHALPDDLRENKGALEDVERTGRTALAEMRRLLGAMRRDSDDLELGPQPGLAGLDALVDDVRRSGLDVGLQVDGAPTELPRALDLSAYRIVQEGLTNVLKHAHATRADVKVVYAPTELRVEVQDDGRGGVAETTLGHHGLVGVRERVKIYGGDMHAGAVDGRGFVLSARLPVEPEQR